MLTGGHGIVAEDGSEAPTGADGEVRVKGPLNATTTGLHLTADIPDPDPWWRLTSGHLYKIMVKGDGDAAAGADSRRR